MNRSAPPIIAASSNPDPSATLGVKSRAQVPDRSEVGGAVADPDDEEAGERSLFTVAFSQCATARELPAAASRCSSAR